MSDDTDETSAVLRRIEAELDDVEGALGRLQDGTYGVCVSCGRAITDERLQAEPTARSCEDCDLAASGHGDERGDSREGGDPVSPEPAGGRVERASPPAPGLG